MGHRTWSAQSSAQSGYPVIGSLGFNGSNNFWNTPLVRGEYFTFFVLDDNATKIVGKHEIQFGFHGRRDILNYLPQQQRSGGALTFPGVTTALYDPAYPDRSIAMPNTGSALAAAFLGTANYEYRVVKGKYYMRRNELAGYVQDNFRATARLTLNLGLRWDFNPTPTEKNNVFTSYDKKTGAIVLGRDMQTLYNLGAVSRQYIAATESLGVQYETPKQAGLPYHMVYNNWHDVSPHLGFAYRALDGRRSFVIRGGYSENFYPVPMYGWNDASDEYAVLRRVQQPDAHVAHHVAGRTAKLRAGVGAEHHCRQEQRQRDQLRQPERRLARPGQHVPGRLFRPEPAERARPYVEPHVRKGSDGEHDCAHQLQRQSTAPTWKVMRT